MAIKTLQNNFTTPEQSKRLLELGVPADSADCYLLRSKYTATFYPHVLICETYTQLDKFLNVLDYLPCWSVGRLIEMHLQCCTALSKNDAHIVISKFALDMNSLINDIYQMIAEQALLGNMDFSKLEE